MSSQPITVKHKPNCLLLDPEEPKCSCSCGVGPTAVQASTEFLCEDGELQNLLNFSVDMALGRCGQDEAMYWMELLDSVTARLGNQTHAAGLADALEWYAEKVKECRKVGSDGDNARQALDLDGGFRALNALADRHVQADSWAPSDHEYDRSIHSNPDAKAWADMFVSTFPGLADKHELMLGWFANAMMAMHDHLMRKAEQPQLPDGWRQEAGEAASVWLNENDPDGLDWCDSRNVDALLDAILTAAPMARTQLEKYDDVLLPFLRLMRKELQANSSKGDRPAWLEMDHNTALLEIYYHLGKLQKAVKDRSPEGIREHAADVANMSMMLVDGFRLLTTESTVTQPSAIQSSDCEWCAGARHDHYGEKCQHCASPADGLAAALEATTHALVFNPSCQRGLVEQCKCRDCALALSGVALAAHRAGVSE